jgi:hypothetical protein
MNVISTAGFIEQNALRNKRRLALTVGSVTVSLILLTALEVMVRGFTGPAATEHSAMRLVVRHKVSLAGGALGGLLSLPLQGLATGTFNWRSFAEVAFEFCVTGGLLAGGLAFAVVMGLPGGLLPARLAAHKSMLDSRRPT